MPPKEKIADVGAARVFWGGILARMSHGSAQRDERQRQEAAEMNQVFRELESAAVGPTTQAMRGTRVPMVLRPSARAAGAMGSLGRPVAGMPGSWDSESVPLGMDAGMIRMASLTGEMLAKEAVNWGGLVSGALAGAKKVTGAIGSQAGKIRSTAQSTIGRLVPNTPKATVPKVPAKPMALPASAGNKNPSVAAGTSAPPKTPTTIPPPNPSATATPTVPSGFDRLKGQLSNGQWKTKLPIVAGMAAGAYGAYRVGKAGINTMLGAHTPRPPRYNAGGVSPAYGVNEYGQPDRGQSFY